MDNYCSVSDQFCTAPADGFRWQIARGECYACGLKVCGKCSSKRDYYKFGKVRLCNNCQIQFDGNDNRVKARHEKLAKR
jgi:hypothetical protein